MLGTRERLRIGVIGVGAIGEWHARILAESPQAVLAAVCDRNGARAEAVAARFGARAFADVETMLATAGLDGVIVASPDLAHEAHAVAAARHKLPMLIEKPLAPDVAALLRIGEAAAAAGVNVMAGHVERFELGSAQLKAAVDQGVCGRISALAARRQFVGVDAPRFRGLSTTLRILAVHDFDLIGWIHPAEVTSVYAAAARGRIFEETGLDDHVVTTIRFADGAVAVVESAWTLPRAYGAFTTPEGWSPAGHNRLEVFGDLGLVSNDMGLRNQQLIAFDAAEGYRAAGLRHQSILHGRVAGALVEEVGAFLRMVGEGAPASPGLDDARRALSLTAMAEESLRLGLPVSANSA